MERLRTSLERVMTVEALRYRAIREHVSAILALVQDDDVQRGSELSHEQLVNYIIAVIERNGAPMRARDAWVALREEITGVTREQIERAIWLEVKRPSSRLENLGGQMFGVKHVSST